MILSYELQSCFEQVISLLYRLVFKLLDLSLTLTRQVDAHLKQASVSPFLPHPALPNSNDLKYDGQKPIFLTQLDTPYFITHTPYCILLILLLDPPSLACYYALNYTFKRTFLCILSPPPNCVPKPLGLSKP